MVLDPMLLIEDAIATITSIYDQALGYPHKGLVNIQKLHYGCNRGSIKDKETF